MKGILQVVSGGVASNQYVRARLDHVVNKRGVQLVCPPPSLCTDNGKSFSRLLPIADSQLGDLVYKA